MFRGADNARFATAMTTGVRQPLHTKSISCISANPAEALAVKVRAPVAEAAMHVAKALCSDSVHTNSVCTSPLATYSLNFSTIIVCGVIGYAATTSTSDCFAAYATASSPLKAIVSCPFAFFVAILFLLQYHLYCFGWAFICAYPTALTETQVKFDLT